MLVRQGGTWVIRLRRQVAAEHAGPVGRGQLTVQPEHGPGAIAGDSRRRRAAPRPATTTAVDLSYEVEVRDPAIYGRLLESDLLEDT